MTPESDAMTILQGVLDTQADATMRGDIDAFMKTVTFPHRLILLNGQYLIERPEDLAVNMSAWCKSLRNMSVNNTIHLVTSAEYLAPDFISGFFVSHNLCNAMPVVDSYENRVVLKLQPEGHWATQEVQAQVSIARMPPEHWHVPTHPVPIKSAPLDDQRRFAMDALSIYKRYLEDIASTAANDDFEGYAALMHFPYTAHGSDLDSIIRNPDDLRPFYEVMRKCNDGTIGDEVVRTALSAEFVGADLICGYHEGIVRKNGEITVEPVNSRMILKRTGHVWRLQTVTNSIDNDTYPFSMYEPGGVLRTHLEIQQRNKQ